MAYFYIQTSGRHFSDLHMNFGGYEECKPLHKWGPVIRPVYILHYILKGKGFYQARDSRWDLGEGEGFLIEPEVATFYQADAQDPWTYVWIGFDGSLTEELLHHLGLGPDRLTFRCRQKEKLRETVLAMLQGDTASFANDFHIQSLLYRFWGILLQDLETDMPVQHGRQNVYINQALEFIRNEYFLPIKVEDIARKVHINRSYLCTIFQKELGVSVSEYLSGFRLSRAAELLPACVIPIEQVAYSCGYKDPLVFSKAFKRKYGVAPLKYRQHHIQENIKKMKDN